MKKIRSYIFDLRSILVAYFFLIYQLLKISILLFNRYFFNRKTYKIPQSQTQSKPQPQTIVHINTFDKGGGAAEIAFSLMEEQLKNGLNAYLIVGSKRTNHPNVIEIPKINSKFKSYFQNANKILQWQDLLQYDSLFLNQIEVIKKADVIHLHNLHSGYFSIFSLLSFRKKNMIWTLHDMHAFTGNCAHSFSCDKWISGCGGCENLSTYPKLDKDTTSFLWKVRSYLFKSLSIKIVTPSNWLLHKVKQSYLGHNANFLIYNGIDTSIYKPIDQTDARIRLNIPFDKKVILFSAELGSKNIYKGGKYIEKIIAEESLKDVLFINIGGGEEMVKTENVWSIPYIKEPELLVKYYTVAEIYLYPSLADNCPLVVLEAMACGLAINTFNTGGIPELVEHEVTGLIAPYKDGNQLSQNLTTLIQDRKFCVEMGGKGMEIVKRRFSFEKMNEEYINLYH